VAEYDAGVSVPSAFAMALSCEPNAASGFAPGFGGAT
jgi:hypothetical protein